MIHHKLNPAVAAVALLALTGTGCGAVKSGVAALSSDYDAWEGHTARELLDSWGTPDATEELGQDYVAYTWLGEAEECRRTFMVRAGTITGYSESDC